MVVFARTVALGAVAALFVAAPHAWASPSAKLVYVRGAGAEACPAEHELRNAVAARIGYDPFFPAAQKTVVAQVARTSLGYRGNVQIVGDDGTLRGERELSSSGDDCAEIVSAMALAMSIALDDLDEAPPPAAPPDSPSLSDPEPKAMPIVEAPSARPPPAAPAVERGPPIELAASAGPLVSLGTAPAAAVGGSVAALMGYRRLGVRLAVRGELPAAGKLGPTGIVSTNTTVASVSMCVRAKIPFGCIGPGIGVIASTTEGITRPASDRAMLVVLLATVGADVALGRGFYVEPLLEGSVNLVPRRVEVDGRQVFSVSMVTGTVGLHVGARFL